MDNINSQRNTTGVRQARGGVSQSEFTPKDPTITSQLFRPIRAGVRHGLNGIKHGSSIGEKVGAILDVIPIVGDITGSMGEGAGIATGGIAGGIIGGVGATVMSAASSMIKGVRNITGLRQKNDSDTAKLAKAIRYSRIGMK